MSEVLQANVFFFITGIAVIVFTFLLSIALYHVIRLLQSVRRIVDRFEAGSEAIAEDLEHLRVYITEQSFLSRFFGGVFRHKEEDEAPTRASRAGLPEKKSTRQKGKTELRIRNEE